MSDLKALLSYGQKVLHAPDISPVPVCIRYELWCREMARKLSLRRGELGS